MSEKLSRKAINSVVRDLENRGDFVLAASIQEVLGSKESKRTAKIRSIKIAAKARDKMEEALRDLLENNSSIREYCSDILSTMDSDLDKLEDRIAKILYDYLEMKSLNQESKK